MKVISVLLGAVAVAGVGSKPIFAKLVHLISLMYAFFGCTCISNDPWPEYLLKFVKS